MLILMNIVLWIFAIVSGILLIKTANVAFKNDDIIMKLCNPLSATCVVNMFVAVKIIKYYSVMNLISALQIFTCYVIGFYISIMLDAIYVIFQMLELYPNLFTFANEEQGIEKCIELMNSRTDYIYQKTNLARKIF